MNVVNADDRVRAELGRAMRRQAPIGALSAAMAAVFIANFAWNQASHAVVAGWLGGLLLLKAAQVVGQFSLFSAGSNRTEGQQPERSHAGHLKLQHVQPRHVQPRHLHRWERFYLGFMMATGCFWAAAAFLFLAAGDSQSNAYIMVALCALGAGSVPALMYHLAGMTAFLVLVFVPAALRLSTLAGTDHLAIAAGSLVFMAFMMGFGRIQARVTRESIRLRHENLDLVASLRRQKEATESALRLAEGLSKAKSQFFAAASHDLRQPLHALALFSATLRELNPEPEKRAVVDQVYASIEALETLFDEVLDLSKLDAGYIEPKPVHHPIAPLLNALRQQFAPLAAQSGLALRVVDSRAVVCSDPTLLSRIVSNLVANAIRYTPSGSVLVGCRRRADALRIEVRDTGIGIPADQHERIFDEFQQLANPERDRRKGLGLGLTTVRRLSDLLGHRLELSSVVGCGTVFTLCVPLGDAGQVKRQTTPALETVDLLAGKRIVIVDDEPAIRRGMQELLARWGCLPVTAADEAQAVALLDAAGPPDLIICDHRLAGPASGAHVIDRLRGRYGAAIPAMLITADTSPERLRETRATGHLLQHKPVRPAQLRAACNQLLASSMP